MKAPALLFLIPLLSAGADLPVTLFDDLVEVAPGHARSLAIPARQGAARLACSFRVLRGPEARLVLIPAESVDAWIEGRAYEELAATPYGRVGSLAHLPRSPRELVLVVQARNGSSRATRLRLLARFLDPAVPFPPSPRPAERWRGAVLVWSSLAVFALAAIAGAARLQRLFASRR